MNRVAYHHGALADALLAEALTQVRAQGGERVSLRAIAQQVGVSPSAAYHHFPDKSALLGAVATAGFAELATRMAAGLARRSGDTDADAIARFEEIGAAYIGFALDEPQLFRHMFTADCPDTVKDRTQAETFQLLDGVLDDLDRRHLLAPGSRPGLALLAWTTVHGFACLALEELVSTEETADLLSVIRRVVVPAGPGPTGRSGPPSDRPSAT